MPKIFIDFGHGGSDPGAVAQIRESQYTLSYGLELGRALTQLGFDIAYSRTSDVDVSLSQRCALANNFGADYFVSVHFNAGGGHGIETYALAPGGRAEILANAVQKELIVQTNSTNRGVKFANFQVLRDTSMPAILIEGGFVDSDSDSAMIPTEDYRRKYVRAVTRAICGVTRASWYDVYTPAVIVPPVVVIPPIVPPAPVVPKDKNAQIISLLEQLILVLKS